MHLSCLKSVNIWYICRVKPFPDHNMATLILLKHGYKWGSRLYYNWRNRLTSYGNNIATFLSSDG